MARYDAIVRERQKAIRREIDRRGIAIKAVQFDAGWENASTLLSYFPADQHAAPAVMSVAALFRLTETGALPLDLLSMLLPEGVAMVRVPNGVDHDRLADEFADYLKAKNECHRPESECGPAIGPGEDSRLRGKLVSISGGRAAA